MVEQPYVSDIDVRESITEFMGTAVMTDRWMRTSFKTGPLVGQTPVELVLAGRGQEVLDLIDAVRDGAFL